MNRWSLSCVLLLGALTLGRATIAAGGCAQMSSLAGVLDEATRLRDSSPRAAVLTCYVPVIDSQLFLAAAAELQERFLFEFFDTCQVAAAKLATAQALPFRQRAIRIGDRYLEWYRESLDDAKRAALDRLTQHRIARLAAFQGEVLWSIGDRVGLLTRFESLCNSAGSCLLSRSALVLWEKVLTSYPDRSSRLTTPQIVKLTQDDPDYEAHWEAYKECLNACQEALGKSPFVLSQRRRAAIIVPEEDQR